MCLLTICSIELYKRNKYDDDDDDDDDDRYQQIQMQLELPFLSLEKLSTRPIATWPSIIENSTNCRNFIIGNCFYVTDLLLFEGFMAT
jgi:hypothetical protein